MVFDRWESLISVQRETAKKIARKFVVYELNFSSLGSILSQYMLILEILGSFK